MNNTNQDLHYGERLYCFDSYELCSVIHSLRLSSEEITLLKTFSDYNTKYYNEIVGSHYGLTSDDQIKSLIAQLEQEYAKGMNRGIEAALCFIDEMHRHLDIERCDISFLKALFELKARYSRVDQKSFRDVLEFTYDNTTNLGDTFIPCTYWENPEGLDDLKLMAKKEGYEIFAGSLDPRYIHLPKDGLSKIYRTSRDLIAFDKSGFISIKAVDNNVDVVEMEAYISTEGEYDFSEVFENHEEKSKRLALV